MLPRLGLCQYPIPNFNPDHNSDPTNPSPKPDPDPILIRTPTPTLTTQQ